MMPTFAIEKADGIIGTMQYDEGGRIISAIYSQQ
jgi:hypothetical protein